MRIIASASCAETADTLSKALGVVPIRPTYTFFPDGEISVDISPESIKNSDCLLVHALTKPINNSIMMLLLEINALKRSRAGKIALYLPYLAYARQTHTQPLIASLIHAAGADACITIDPHTQLNNTAIPFETLSTCQLFADHIKATHPLDDLVIVAPDQGAIERCTQLHHTLSLTSEIAYIDKTRINGSCASHTLHGTVNGKRCIIIDDIIDTGTTLCNASNILIKHGAAGVFAYCTHGVLSEGALDRVQKSVIQKLVITNTIQQHPNTIASPRIEIICTAHLLCAQRLQAPFYSSDTISCC